MRRHGTLLALLAGWLLALPACDLGTFEQDFDTELTVFDPGPNIDFLEISKRFRFSSDPAQADNVEVVGARVDVTAPEGSDFAFLQSLEVYVELGDEELLIASTGVFDPRADTLAMNVDFDGDLRPWTADQRVSLRFVASPVRTFTGWPVGGYTVRATVTILVEAL